MLSGCPELEAQKGPCPNSGSSKKTPCAKVEAQKGTLSIGTSSVLPSMEVPPPPPRQYRRPEMGSDMDAMFICVYNSGGSKGGRLLRPPPLFSPKYF